MNIKDGAIILNDMEDIKKLLIFTINQVASGNTTDRKAKMINLLCGNLIKVMQLTELEARITELEDQLVKRSN